MYCPSCGKPASTEQKFCRACGFDLQAMSQMLAGQPSKTLPDNTTEASAAPEQSPRRKHLRWGFLVFWLGIMVGVFFTIIGDALQNLDHQVGNMVEDLGALGGMICVGGIGLMIYSLFLPKTLPPVQSLQFPALPQADSTAKMNAERRPEAVPSVTEHTTIKLEPPDYERPRPLAQESKE